MRTPQKQTGAKMTYNNENNTKAIRKTLKTVKDAAEAMLEKKRYQVKESTFARYNYCIERYILPDLGETKLEQLSERQLNKYLTDKLTGGRIRGDGTLSWKTVSDIRSLLSSILEYAAKNGYPTLSAIQMVLPKQNAKPMQVLTKQEQKILVKHMLNDLTPVNLGILISLYDGLRIGEVCGLMWGDIDFYYGTMRVERTVTRIPNVTEDGVKKTKLLVTAPKTQHSIRTIPIPDDILELLKQFPFRDMDWMMLCFLSFSLKY